MVLLRIMTKGENKINFDNGEDYEYIKENDRKQ
jgi:hypothetical protein